MLSRAFTAATALRACCAAASVLTAAAGCDGGLPISQPLHPPENLTTAGSYRLVSEIDVTAGSLLPDPVADYLGVLSELRDDPAHTLLTLADQAGVPLVDTLFDALPDVLDDKLAGWINDYVRGARFGAGPATDELDALLAQASSVLTRFDLVSDLDLTAPDTQARATAVHTLLELRYRLWETRVEVAVPLDLPADSPASRLLVRRATAPAFVTAGLGGADAHLAVGEHGFGVPYGTFAFRALEAGTQQRYGVDVRGLLARIIDCPGLGASVAGRCLIGGICVGHAAELTAVCDAGLDQVAATLRRRIESLNFKALRLHGDAELCDAPTAAPLQRDGRADRLDRGVWQATIDIGMGPRDVPATFTGARQSP